MQLEDVINILKKDYYYGVMVQFGGQNAVNLAVPIDEEIKRLGLKTRILGTSPDAMDMQRIGTGSVCSCKNSAFPHRQTVQRIRRGCPGNG